MLPALLGYAGKKLATSAVGGIAKSLFGSSDKKESKDQENLSSKMSADLFNRGKKLAAMHAYEEKAADKEKGFKGTLSKIRKGIFGGEGSGEAGSTGKVAVKRESKVVADAVNNSNQILDDILSTLQQSLALQQSVAKPSREELLEQSTGAFEDKPKSVGSRIATSAKSAGSSLAKVAGIGAAGLAAGFGAQGFLNAEDTFGVDEATMSQKLASALGNIIEKATFGLVKNKDIAVNIDSFFTSVATKFNEGIKFLKESKAVKAIKELFAGIFSMDLEKTKTAAKKLGDMITNAFQKMFDAIAYAIGGVIVPSNKITDALGIGGRSLSFLVGGEARTFAEKEEVAIEKEKKKKSGGVFNEATGKFGMQESQGRANRRLEDVKLLRQGKMTEEEYRAKYKDTKQGIFGDPEVEAQPKVTPQLEVEETEGQSAEDSARVQALRARKAEYLNRVNEAHDNMEVVPKEKTTINNTGVNNVVNQKTIASAPTNPRNTESALAKSIDSNAAFGIA